VEVLFLSILYTKQMFKIPSTCTKARMDMSDFEMSRHFKSPEVVANVLTDKKKCSGEVSFRFQLERNTLGVLSVPRHKNLED
jgi:hypothetical protein